MQLRNVKNVDKSNIWSRVSHLSEYLVKGVKLSSCCQSMLSLVSRGACSRM